MLDKKELKDFVNFSQNKWPGLRSKYLKQLKTRCTNCIASSAYTTINPTTMLCEACTNFYELNVNQSNYENYKNNLDLVAQLNDLINVAQQNNALHEVLVLISGGKDSLYMLHKLVNTYKSLKILAVFVDNGFQSHIAKKNITELLKVYPTVDFMDFKPQKNLYSKMFRHVILQANKLEGYSKVDDFDGFLTFDIGLNLAYQLNIPLVFAGLNRAQAQEYYHAELIRPPEEAKENRSELYGIPLQDFHNAFEARFWWNGSDKLEDKIPKLIFPLAIEGRSELNIIFELLGSKLIEATENHPFYTNSSMLPFLMYLDFKKYGYSHIEFKLTKMIRRKEADKVFWLKHLEAIEFLTLNNQFFPKSIAGILEILDLQHVIPSTARDLLP